jgi:hypothetical protein
MSVWTEATLVTLLAAPPIHHPSLVLVITTGTIAFLLTLLAWTTMSTVVTIAHEGGHALTASAVGGTVRHILIKRRNGGGETLAPTPTRGGSFLTGLAGYVGPPAFGVCGALLLHADKVRAVLWVSMVFLACSAALAKDWFSLTSPVILGAVIALVLRSHSPTLQVWFAYTWVWFLLFSGVRDVLDLARMRHRPPDTGSDAFGLREMTPHSSGDLLGTIVLLGGP